MKKFLSFIFTLLLVFSFVSVNAGDTASDNNNSKTLSIVDIDSSNSNLLKVFIDKEIDTNSININSDLKLFKDLSIENISRDLENDKQVNISLKDELEKNTSYSLLPIFGVEGSIDFKIEDLLNGLEITGNKLDGVEKLIVVDSKHLKVIFSGNVESENIDIKILKSIIVDKIVLNDKNKKELQLFLKNSLKNQKKYLIMMFSLNTNEGNQYTISNYIYDFKSLITDSSDIKAPEKDNLAEKAKLNKVALNSASTPDSGPETWILLLFTFILSTIVFFRKKFSK